MYLFSKDGLYVSNSERKNQVVGGSECLRKAYMFFILVHLELTVSLAKRQK